MVEKALVYNRHWLNDSEFWECITLAQALPGVFAVNMALYTGFRIAGKRGAAAAAIGAIIPSLLIIIIIASFFTNLTNHPTVNAIFSGIRPCVVALIFAPGLRMLEKVRHTPHYLLLPIIVILLVCVLSFSPIIIILSAIIIALLLARFS